MPITVLSDVILPDRVIRAGIRGKQMRKNARSETSSGRQQANVLWTQTLREFQVGIKPMKPAAWLDLERIFEVTDGGAYGFLMKDPKDQSVSITTGVILEVDGVFLLYERYQVGANYRDRRITRPIAGATLYVDGGSVAGTYSTTSGVVTFDDSPPGGGAMRWIGSYYVPVHFADDSIDWELLKADPDVADRLVAGPACTLREIRE